MCCTGSRHTRPAVSRAELMKEREAARKRAAKRGESRVDLGAYRAWKELGSGGVRCATCGEPKPADGLKDCHACRETERARLRAAASRKPPRLPGRAREATITGNRIRGQCEVCGKEVSRKLKPGEPARCVHLGCASGKAEIRAVHAEPKCSRCNCRPRLEGSAQCQVCKDYTDARDARHRDRIARQRGESEPTPRKEAA